MTRHTPRAGLLPLMLELYDQSHPDLKPRQAQFVREVAQALGDDIEITRTDVCNTRDQVAAAVREFEAAGVDGLIVLHLSYAPSLISVPALIDTELPLLLLNTTPAPFLAGDLTQDDVLRNHGIHGVQDLANILLRSNKPYHIVSGHITDPAVIDGTVSWLRAAATVRFLRELRVGLIGDPFPGMGDFAVDPTALQVMVGPELARVSPREVVGEAKLVPDDHVEHEVRADRKRYEPDPDLDAELHSVSVRAGLGLQKVVESRNLGAFSLNFTAFNDLPEIGTVPFLGISKLQAAGIGYAGEGDVACASLVAAMAHYFGQAAFTEMFCPDWEGDTLLMAHMGECNPDLAGQKPVLKTVPFRFGDLSDPAILFAGFAPGLATLVNLVCIGGDIFRLTAAEVEVPEFELADITMPHFRVQPALPLGEFLTAYSDLGGSHHLAIVPGHVAYEISLLANLAGLEFGWVM